MKTLEIHGTTGKSTLLVGEKLENLHVHLPPFETVIITDENIRRLYGDQFPQGRIIEIGMGEGIKTLETVKNIFQELVEHEADRTVFIVGIGGGIVCDITGFAASTYLRGVRFGFVATTLLAQVDAGVGGKNGVNFSGYKNMVGVFNQPEFVICDPGVLKTLSKRDRGCGLAEVVKHAAIADDRLFNYLEKKPSGGVGPRPGSRAKNGIRFRGDKIGDRQPGRKGNRGTPETQFRTYLWSCGGKRSAGFPMGEAVSIGMMAAAKLSAGKRASAGIPGGPPGKSA